MSTAEARAAGIRQANAPVVAFVEDHSYPDPDWAERLIEAHRKPWAAVGPVMVNANPATMISWANLLVEYAQWVEPVAEGVVCHLPGHNSSYKRAILLDYGSDLEAMLEAESILHWDLQAKGYRLYLEPAAKTHHLNVSLLSSTGLLRFYGGRSFATARARDWSLLGRLLYAGGAPLIPLVRLWRIIGELRKPGRECSLLPRILPALVFVLTFGAAGEMIGYVFGAGNSVKKLSDLEFHRSRHLAERDRQVYTDR